MELANPSKDIIFLRKVNCPVCNKNFITPTVRVGRIHFIDSDLDLRPMYEGFDPIPYDVVACNHCGYAALNKYFMKVSESKIENIKRKISTHYKEVQYPEKLTYDIAIERYKLALLCCAFGRDSNGTKAYLCLKISWLYRSWRESIEIVEGHSEALVKKIKAYEIIFIEKAYEGFLIAYDNESFPIMGIEQSTMEYLIAELARRLGDYDNARQWLSRLLMRKNLNKRLNEKAIEVKNLINAATK